MPALTFGKKYRYVIATVCIALLAVFYLREDIDRVSLDFLQGRKQTIGSYLACADSPVFDPLLLQARKGRSDRLRLLVHFTEKPSAEVGDFFLTQGVQLYRDTWILDYAVAETTVTRLCFLADLPGITMISLGE